MKRQLIQITSNILSQACQKIERHSNLLFLSIAFSVKQQQKSLFRLSYGKVGHVCDVKQAKRKATLAAKRLPPGTTGRDRQWHRDLQLSEFKCSGRNRQPSHVSRRPRKRGVARHAQRSGESKFPLRSVRRLPEKNYKI